MLVKKIRGKKTRLRIKEKLEVKKKLRAKKQLEAKIEVRSIKICWKYKTSSK